MGGSVPTEKTSTSGISAKEPLSIDEFLVEEYTTLRELRENTISLLETRLNFFLAALSGAVIGLGLVNQLPASGYAQTMYFLNGVIITTMLCIGLITYRRTVMGNFRVIKYSRGMNRIRRYFVEKEERISAYLSLPINDDIPKFKGRFPVATALINSSVAGTGSTLLARTIFDMQVIWVYLVGLTVFATILLAQYIYYLGQERKETRQAVINFPTKNSK